MSTNILLADDNVEFFGMCLSNYLSPENGYHLHMVSSVQACQNELKNRPYDVVVLDIDFGAGSADGFSLVPEIKARCPETRILMYSNSDDTRVMRHATAVGADDFASKSRNSAAEIFNRVKSLLARRAARTSLIEQGKQLATAVGAAYKSLAMQEVFRLTAQYRGSKSLNVLITGPTGSGKELLAQAFKENGRPFVAVNCGGLSAGLIESTFFGHARGSFTGAMKDQIGVFEQADGGDLFLDEVARLPMHAQTALLRIMETKEVQRVGSHGMKSAKVRIIAATNEDLDAMVKAGTFREDLLARLKGGHIIIPALADRRDDIPAIVQKILEQEGRGSIEVASDLMYVLGQLPWKQNIRQLKQAVRRMLTNCQNDMLTIGDLPEELLAELAPTSSGPTPVSNTQFMLHLPLDISFEEAQRELFVRMIEVKRRGLGPQATQQQLANSLKMPRSSLQRYLKQLNLGIKC